MDTIQESILTAYNQLDDQSKATVTAYAEILSTKASLQSAMDALAIQETGILSSLIGDLSKGSQTKESLALLNALSRQLANLHSPSVDSIPPHHKKKRKVARIAFIAALILVAIIPYGLFAFAGDVRQAIRNTFIGGNATTYYMTTTGSLSLAGMHAPAYMPQGYSLTAKEASNKANISILTYENPTGAQIKFYFYHTDGEAASIDNENGTISTVQVGNYPAMVSEGQDGVNMISGVYGEDSSYRIEGELPVDALIDMAASIAMQ